MAWCCQAPSHYLNQCWPRSLPPYGIIRPQCVNLGRWMAAGDGIECIMQIIMTTWLFIYWWWLLMLNHLSVIKGNLISGNLISIMCYGINQVPFCSIIFLGNSMSCLNKVLLNNTNLQLNCHIDPIRSQLCTCHSSSAVVHDDVIKWRHFPHYCPFVRGFTGHQWIPLTKASDAKLWYFLWSTPE